MLPIDALFCPCCTPALLHSLAQSGPQLFSKQALLLGTGALVAAIAQPKSPVVEADAASKEADNF